MRNSNAFYVGFSIDKKDTTSLSSVFCLIKSNGVETQAYIPGITQSLPKTIIRLPIT